MAAKLLCNTWTRDLFLDWLDALLIRYVSLDVGRLHVEVAA
jgi:hypothetical protein